MSDTTDEVQLYVMLGAAGSGRRELLADLIGGGLGAGDRAAVYVAQDEQPAPAEVEAALTRVAVRATWRLDAEGTLELDVVEGVTHAFLLVDGRANPVDQLEALAAWLPRQVRVTLARLFCVVNCRLAEAHHELLSWYDACVHFADVVLLTDRAGVANRWMSDFQRRYADQFFPCVIEMVKEGRVKNPVALLEPEARRISQVFDADALEEASLLASGVMDEATFIGEDEDDEEGEELDDNEEGEGGSSVDPYFARRLGGKRVRVIPDIADFLSPPAAES